MPSPHRTIVAIATAGALLAGGASVGLAQSDGQSTTPTETTPSQEPRTTPRTTPEGAPDPGPRDGRRGPCPERDGSDGAPGSSAAPSSGDAALTGV